MSARDRKKVASCRLAWSSTSVGELHVVTVESRVVPLSNTCDNRLPRAFANSRDTILLHIFPRSSHPPLLSEARTHSSSPVVATVIVLREVLGPGSLGRVSRCPSFTQRCRTRTRSLLRRFRREGNVLNLWVDLLATRDTGPIGLLDPLEHWPPYPGL